MLSGISDTSHVLESQVGVPGGGQHATREEGVQAPAPRDVVCKPVRRGHQVSRLEKRAAAAATLPRRTAGPAPFRPSPRISLDMDRGVMDLSASKTTFRRPFCPGSGYPSLVLGRRQHPKTGDVF